MPNNSNDYHSNNQSPEVPQQWPFNKKARNGQLCNCRKEPNTENHTFNQPLNVNPRYIQCCACDKTSNNEEKFTLNCCMCRKNNMEHRQNSQYNSQPSTFHVEQQSIQSTNGGDPCLCNQYENSDFQVQPRQGDMQLKCQCKACRKKVHAKFGLAWIVEGPGYENYEEPTGWQMEFIDTPSCVFHKCQEMMHWVNSPPIQTSNYITENNRFTTRGSGYSGTNSHTLCLPYNQTPCNICGRFRNEGRCYCTPRVSDEEEQPVKDTQTSAPPSKSYSKEILTSPLDQETNNLVEPNPVQSAASKKGGVAENEAKPATKEPKSEEPTGKPANEPNERRRMFGGRKKAK